MAETNLEKKPASLYTILLTLTWGDPLSPHTVRYCRSAENITVGADTFTACPSLDVDDLIQSGGVEDRPARLTMPISLSPFDRLATGYKHPEVKATIEQMDPSDFTTRRHLHMGWLGVLRRNPSGKAGFLRCDVEGIKSRLRNVNLSIIATTTCDLRFGGVICRKDSSAWTRTGTVTSINRNLVTLNLTGVTTPATQLPNNRYRRGDLVIDGLHLPVKRSNADNTFALFCLAPPWIVGQSCTLFAGCGKRLEDCRLWENESNFRGIAISTPARNPIFQDG